MSREVPKICGHEMIRVSDRRYEWTVPRAVRVQIWKPWWGGRYRARIWLTRGNADSGFDWSVDVPNLADEAYGAALVITNWLTRVSESLVYALSRPKEER